jgi:hypothetical protein
VPILRAGRSSPSTAAAASVFRREAELVARETALVDRERRVEMLEALAESLRRRLEAGLTQLEQREGELARREGALSEEPPPAAAIAGPLGSSYPDERAWWERQLGRTLESHAR